MPEDIKSTKASKPDNITNSGFSVNVMSFNLCFQNVNNLRHHCSDYDLD